MYGTIVCEGEEEVVIRTLILGQSMGSDASLSTRVHQELSSKDSIEGSKVAGRCLLVR